MNTTHFANKVCWITGASSGIGSALALSLNEMGATLILSARDKEKMETIRAGSPNPGKISILPCNLEDTQTLASVTKQAWNIFQGIDYVFLNAGMAVRDTIIHTEMELIRKVMNINFFSNVVISKTLLPFMCERGQGCFVVTNSLSGKFGIPKLAAYSASKHALHGFFETLRAEYKNEGIKVSMITVGLVNTPITLHALKGDGSNYGKMQNAIAAGISPETCARSIIKAVARGKCEALVGALEKYSVLVKRFFPGLLRMAITRHPIQKLRKAGLLKSPPIRPPDKEST
jgi:dehydrogenase/reductase SDR family member 7B